MKRWLFGLLLLPVIALATGSSPYGVFGGAGTFAQLPGNIPLVFTAGPNGWQCFAQDITHNVVFTQTASQVYSCTVTGTTTSGDIVQFNATPY